uniref:Exocrine gland secreted peptide 22 n=1 Tax=Mus spicilegus TaxID=10103 RepID=A0A8C6MNT4_MUSSI
MNSVPVMLFSISILLAAMLTEGSGLTQTQKESIFSAEHKSDLKSYLEMLVCRLRDVPESVIHISKVSKEILPDDLLSTYLLELLVCFDKDKLVQSKGIVFNTIKRLLSNT